MNTLDNIKWYPDRMIFNDYLYRLEHNKSENWNYGTEYFTFYKVRELVDQYERFFKRNINNQFSNLFELGIFHGGSMPFWNDFLNPVNHIGVELKDVIVTDYLKDYINRKKANGNNIHIHSGVNQSDRKKLIDIVNQHFESDLDIVIDDASHLYYPSKASFETLFPLLRPGGFYIIEDWAWGHWEDFFSPTHFWANEIPPTKLIHEITELAGTDKNIIWSMNVYQGFVAIEKGDKPLDKDSFLLEKYIKRRPKYDESPIIKMENHNLINKLFRKLGLKS